MRATEFINTVAEITSDIFDELNLNGYDHAIATIMQAILTAKITRKLIEKGVIEKDEN